MKNIYHIHQSSNSYWDSRWTDTDYYLCDSEEEYQQKLAEYTEKRKQIEKEFKENPTELSKSRALFLQLSKEQKVHASEWSGLNNKQCLIFFILRQLGKTAPDL